MSDITPDEYRIAAKVLGASWKRGDFPYSAQNAGEYCAEEADRLEAESARDEEAEKLAEVMLAAEREHWLSVGMNRYEDGFQGLTGDFRVAYLNAASKVRGIAEWLIAEAAHREHARLAADGRLLPEGGVVLKPLCGSSHFMRRDIACTRIAGHDGDHDHQFGNGEGVCWPAASAPLVLPTEPGSRIRASVRRWPDALEWSACDPYVDTFQLDGAGDWEAENGPLGVCRLVHDYITVLEVLPAVSVPDSGPRTWTSLDQVPHDVVVTDREGDEHVFDGKHWTRSGRAACVIYSPEMVSNWAPFTEVVPDSGPDGTPEKPWPTAAEIPIGVCAKATDNDYGWRVNDGFVWKGGAQPCPLDRANLYAPFVRVDGDKA